MNNLCGLFFLKTNLKKQIWMILGFFFTVVCWGQAPNIYDPNDQTATNLEKPGTLTFETGSKIVVQIEKPQVKIFLEKKRAKLMIIDEKKSFLDLVQKPLNLNTLNYQKE